MREFKYMKLPGVYPDGLRGPSKFGTILDLLIDCPYFFPVENIPSFSELNRFLSTGVDEHGMSGGCRWKPFAITEEEYAELVEEILTYPGKDLIRPKNARR